MTGRPSDPTLYLELFEFSPSMLAVSDLRGSLIAVNPAWKAALSVRVDSDQPSRFTDLLHSDDAEDAARALADAAAGAPRAGGEHRFATGGGWRTLAWRAVRSPASEVLYLSAGDVAERDAARAELDALVSSLAHDLRAPLRAVDGFAHLLLQSDEAAELPPDARRAVRLVTEASGELARLLDALVEVARVARGPFVGGPVDVADVARDTVARVRGAERRAVEWTVGDLPPAWGDVALVRRLLAELLGNALRFTADRAVAHVDVLWDAEEAAYVVRDDGIGFDDARAEQAFAIFGRLHPARDGDRAGIGLAVAQRIVARHGGRLWVRSRPEGGAAFWFTLAPPDAS